MKRFLLIAGVGIAVAACNSGTNSVEKDNDSSHSMHNTTTDSAGGQNHMMAMHDAMNEMMEQMQGIKPSGDPDHDFAMMMKQHHQGAVNMSRAEIAGGTNDQLKQMAQKMIDAQQKEITEFDRFMEGKQPAGNSDYGKRSMEMMTPMSDIKMESGSLDAMFASMMIPHHQDGMKMAQEYLKVAKSEDLKKIARQMTETHPKEIQELQQWLNKNKGG